MTEVRTEADGSRPARENVSETARNTSHRPLLRHHVQAIIVCPGMFAVLLPGIVLAIAEVTARMWPELEGAAAHPAPRWPGFVLVLPGLILFACTNLRFHRASGTLHPRNGPTELVVDGLYAWMRNPMIVGVFLFLGGMSALLGSWPLAAYLVAFATAKNLYIALHEEPALAAQFGDRYLQYLRGTPLRWLPWPPRSPDRAPDQAVSTR